MAHRTIVPGDFVWIVAPDAADKTLYAVRSILSGQEIRIYPLDNQTRESVLVFREDKWVVLGGENMGYTLEFKSGDPEYYQEINDVADKEFEVPGHPGEFQFPGHGAEMYAHHVNVPNIDALEEANKIHHTGSLEELDRVCADLSDLRITPQQFIHMMQELLNREEDHYFTSDQVEWLLKHGLVPKTYNLEGFLFDDVIGLLKRVDQVSQTSRVYETIDYVQDNQVNGLDEIMGGLPLISYAEYFANKGEVPSRFELWSMTRESSFNETIRILLEKNLITFDSQMLEEIRSGENKELIQIIQQLTPTKSAMKESNRS
jgi:hypothetical protein